MNTILTKDERILIYSLLKRDLAENYNNYNEEYKEIIKTLLEKLDFNISIEDLI